MSNIKSSKQSESSFTIVRVLSDLHLDDKFAKCGHLAKLPSAVAAQFEKSGRVDSSEEAVKYAQENGAELTDFTVFE